MSNSRNTGSVLGIEPMSARSIILSTLLGTHPPTLAGRQLTALAELFDIRPGTVRTALSRMAAEGELVADEGRYGLGPRLVQRQKQQDLGRAEPAAHWDGTWFVAIAAQDSRSLSDRRAFRSTMTGARMGELRPDIWMRPANTPEPDRPEDVLLVRGGLGADDPEDLIDRLWSMKDLDDQAGALLVALEKNRPLLDGDDPAALPSTFLLSAATVRFLRTEPQLPSELEPARWTPPRLRPAYDDFERAFQKLLRNFLMTATTP